MADRGPTPRFLSTLMLVGCVVASPLSAAVGDVILRIEVETLYRDTPSQLALISTLIDELPPTTATPLPDDDLSSFIVRIYRFGPSNAPRTYGILAKKIIELNGLASADEPLPGTVRIPVLPKRALARPGPNRANAVPAIIDVEADPSGASATAESQTPIGRPATQYAHIQVKIPRGSLTPESLRRLVDLPQTRVISSPLRVKTPVETVVEGPADIEVTTLESVLQPSYVTLPPAPTMAAQQSDAAAQAAAQAAALDAQAAVQRAQQQTAQQQVAAAAAVQEIAGRATAASISPAETVTPTTPAASEPQPVIVPPQNEPSAAPMAVAAPASALTIAQEQRIKVLLQQPHRTATLFILDTGWPTAEDYARSRDWFFTAADRIRDHYEFGPRTISGGRPAFVSPSTNHCSQVANSLSELMALDPNGVIRVVYLPLSREQGGEQVLAELLEISDLADKMRRRLGDPAEPDIIAWARADAMERAAAAPERFDNGVIVSDTGIVDAVWTFGELLSRINKEDVYFINESWVVPGGVLKSGAPTDPRGVAVAATGNDDEDIVNEQIDYARRSVLGKDTIAVLNVSPDGKLQCKTNVIAAALLPNAFALGYDGHVPGDCGTSFAAPRIAWLLAAVEVARKDPTPKTLWTQDLFSRVASARRIQALTSLYFDPTLLGAK